MPTVHLICGSTGAGKTTYAMALARRTKGVRFSIDEWMSQLFIADRPDPPTLAWALERIDRCEQQMWAIADQLIERGVDVVFDLGLSRSDHRDRIRFRAAQTRADSKLHYLDVSRERRWARITQRNRERPITYSFELTEAMFDFMETWFEPPTDDELYGAMIVCED
ncbi:MAG: ATP-binding protein [Polyangiaceae bacterium]|jgi:predicted kinase